MIKLTLPLCPSFLTSEQQRLLTDRFLADKTSRVWNHPQIKATLMEMSYGKCAFSEVKLGEEGKYMEVEHFYPKSLYPEKVVEWGNLLPILNWCNMKKRNLDPKHTPLVNPVYDNPKDYFYIENGRLAPRGNGNKKAINTLETYDLNNPQQLRSIRYKCQMYIQKTLGDIGYLYDYNTKIGLDRLKSLMADCGRESEYSAAKSTALLADNQYKRIKADLKASDKWCDEWQCLEEELIFCSLPKISIP